MLDVLERERWDVLGDAYAELAIRAARKDPTWAIEKWVVVPPAPGDALDGAGDKPIELFDCQKDAIDIWRGNAKTCCLKCRQLGLSTAACALTAIEAVVVDKPVSFVFVSNLKENAETLITKIVYAYERLPRWLVHRGNRRSNRSELAMRFDNGTVVIPQAAKEPATSMSPYRVFFDEFGKYGDTKNQSIQLQTKALNSALPATHHGGHLHILSTARGGGVPFQEIYERGKDGRTSWRSHFYPYGSHPDHTQEAYDQLIEDAGSRVWTVHQEYPLDDVKVWLQAQNLVFDSDAIVAQQNRVLNSIYPGFCGFLNPPGYELRDRVVPCFDRDVVDRPVEVFEEPMPGAKYLIGVDMASGQGGDFSVADVYRCAEKLSNGVVTPVVQVAQVRGQYDTVEMGTILNDLRRWYASPYGTAMMVVERERYGMALMAHMSERYTGCHWYTHGNTFSSYKQRKAARGWPTTTVTKPVAIETLDIGLRDGSLMLNSLITLQEMAGYAEDEKGAMNGSPHDDTVIAAMLGFNVAATRSAVTRKEVLAHDGDPNAYTMQRLIDDIDEVGEDAEWLNLL